jgi:hypothetical protein
MNSSRQTTGSNSCFSNYNDNGIHSFKQCPSNLPICSDGWWESSGKITVYEQ